MYIINIWAIIVAAIVSFAIGSLWYSPFMFGKEWMSLVKIGQKDIDGMKMSSMWGSYIIHFLATFVTLCVLAFAITSLGTQNAVDGAFIGFFAWLGFIAPFGISELLWRKSPVKLVLIDSINVLLSLVIGGVIIAAW
jgi:hypothetical protein